jgi:hypothetical protein
MARSDERAARLDAKVKRFARSTPIPKPYNDAPDVAAQSDVAPGLHAALMSVGDQMLAHHDKVASLATVGHALKQVALKIKPSEPDIGSGSGSVSGTPEIGEQDTSGLFGE